MFNLLPCPSSIRYSWFWSGTQRQTRVDSSLWPPGTVTKLPSSTSPGPPKIENPKSPNPQNPKIQNPQNPKIQNPQYPQNPKSTKSQKPKSKILKIPKIQNPKSPKSQIPTIQNPQNRKIQNPQNPKSPKSKIQTFLAGFWGFWIQDFGSLGSNSLREAPNAPNFGFRRRILDFGFWGFWILGILDFGFWTLGIWDFGFWGFGILDFGEFGFWIWGPESQIQNPKSPIQTFLAKFSGFWILDRYVAILYVRPQRPIFWILAGILNFGFGSWGYRILDFAFWT